METWKIRRSLFKIIGDESYPRRIQDKASEYYHGLSTGSTDEETIKRFITKPYENTER